MAVSGFSRPGILMRMYMPTMGMSESTAANTAVHRPTLCTLTESFMARKRMHM